MTSGAQQGSGAEQEKQRSVSAIQTVKPPLIPHTFVPRTKEDHSSFPPFTTAEVAGTRAATVPRRQGVIARQIALSCRHHLPSLLAASPPAARKSARPAAAIAAGPLHKSSVEAASRCVPHLPQLLLARCCLPLPPRCHSPTLPLLSRAIVEPADVAAVLALPPMPVSSNRPCEGRRITHLRPRLPKTARH
ncbi:hypothetical protein CONPUDRAFT_152578 [Coniophora puteana RWD-64-598 SS2]|uniref:Uncharacterized protein n=1 Tax=Coniophora puteana (strain RWD-64-598) TaxID=741705 RepID=A0A5M3MSL6_CONPW|nr:uncharacterized protein CONPUDRAFT_152578 [Coniophora puteana RWD-64-598 SS2]EIW81655.1 hypothetical protein CONPUDRAFT_152578 [Coniophora puteana RWD-64-598 SS2]